MCLRSLAWGFSYFNSCWEFVLYWESLFGLVLKFFGTLVMCFLNLDCFYSSFVHISLKILFWRSKNDNINTEKATYQAQEVFKNVPRLQEFKQQRNQAKGKKTTTDLQGRSHTRERIKPPVVMIKSKSRVTFF